MRLRLEKLADFRASSLERPELRPTAVLVPIQRGEYEDAIVFIRRAGHLRAHAGEVSFPGGKIQDDDSDLCYTALRELQEEIGIEPCEVSIVGRLDQIEVSGQYAVTPFVGMIPVGAVFKIGTNEVEEALTFSADQFLRPACFSVRPYVQHGRSRPTFYFECDETTIWGATARILVQLLELTGEIKFPRL
jgi:8-oxo-dGTP pyrophosphatase MutT (NUDIX family)